MDHEIKRILLKFLILKIIGDRPTHGYELMQAIERLSSGRWTPSPGSIYPALEMLEAKGWIESEEIERRKVYAITPTGQAALKQMKAKWQEQLKEIALFLEAIMEEPATEADSNALQEEYR